MNTVTLLSEAADLDFNGYVKWNRQATFSQYPAVIIDLQLTRSRDPVKNFILIWALYESAWDMVAKNKFCVSDFDVVWKGKVVAKLKYKKATEQELESIGGGESKNNETASLANVATSGGSGTSLVGDIARDTGQLNTTVESPLSARTSNVNVLTLHLQFLRNAKDLPVFSVFMALLAALKDNAYYPSTDRVHPFASSTPGFDSQLSILRMEPPIQTPPFFERTHITNTIRLIPSFMLGERKFCEVAFSFKLGEKGQVDLFAWSCALSLKTLCHEGQIEESFPISSLHSEVTLFLLTTGRLGSDMDF